MRLAEIDAYWAGARNEYALGRISCFLTYLAIGAFRYPDSLLRPRLVYLFLRGRRQRKGRHWKVRGTLPKTRVSL